MPIKIPESHRDLLDGAVVVSLVTLMPDGRPQASPVWASYDGEHVLIITSDIQQKMINVQAQPYVTILAVDPDNAFRYLEIRGVVDEITNEGVSEYINELIPLHI